MYHPTSLDIGPELHGGRSRRTFRCLTCLMKVSATSGLQHIADGHHVVNQDGDRQVLSEDDCAALRERKTA